MADTTLTTNGPDSGPTPDGHSMRGPARSHASGGRGPTRNGPLGGRGPNRLRLPPGTSITLLSLLGAFVLGAVIIAATDETVLDAWANAASDPAGAAAVTANTIKDAYAALFVGAVLDPRADSIGAMVAPLSESIVAATPLMLSGLAVTFALRAGLFNIGGQGQLVLGASAAAYVGFRLTPPAGVHVVLAILAAITVGALWGFIPGWLKARTGAHEVITTIMLNYIAALIVAYLLTTSSFQRSGRNDGISPAVADTARIPPLPGGDLRLHAGILLGLGTAGLLAWLLSRTTLGFELRAIGQNIHAARTAGMSTGKVHMVAMAVAGAAAGLGGSCTMLGADFSLTAGTGASVGFVGISVALLGRSSIAGTIGASLLFGALQAGGIQMQAITGTPVDLVMILQALIILFVAVPMIIPALFRLPLRHRDAALTVGSRGWAS